MTETDFEKWSDEYCCEKLRIKQSIRSQRIMIESILSLREDLKSAGFHVVSEKELIEEIKEQLKIEKL